MLEVPFLVARNSFPCSGVPTVATLLTGSMMPTLQSQLAQPTSLRQYSVPCILLTIYSYRACSFNEPDLSSQSNLTPQQAASAWKQWIQPFAGRAKLCSPAITNGGAPMGTAWLDNFLSACTGCTIDCIAIHIYDSATNNAYFKNYISGIGTKYGKPVWVTEVGLSRPTSAANLIIDRLHLSTVRCLRHGCPATGVPAGSPSIPRRFGKR